MAEGPKSSLTCSSADVTFDAQRKKRLATTVTRGRKKDLTDIERRILRAGLVASVRGRRDKFWAAEVIKTYVELFKTGISWGTALPALRRLEDMQLVTAEWISQDDRLRPIRFYSLTPKGREEAAASQAPVVQLGIVQATRRPKTI